MTIEDTIRRCYQAYVDKDRAAIEALIAEDFTFTSPGDDHINREVYFERCWPNSERIGALRLEKIFVQGDEASYATSSLHNRERAFATSSSFVWKRGRYARYRSASERNERVKRLFLEEERPYREEALGFGLCFRLPRCR